jgi:hypothetical protein
MGPSHHPFTQKEPKKPRWPPVFRGLFLSGLGRTGFFDALTRSVVSVEEVADRSSRMDLVKNDDGTTDIYMGPEAPWGLEKNSPTSDSTGLCSLILIDPGSCPTLRR